ncbi:FAD:protein FMN transferase [Deinococcus metallilatus]|uniref:FAD:protein FMN transferase n=1 Tax=Deinococcus metallilatus TaxID=1211322 RepID=A0AAJ5JZJ7_9DEIO|nr:FAD:protein FMN transferase [Deinococcus metallilatus]MBB5296337.1 thiamine biosynthesis lipoprotein [Deinococcus metallilatus]QBY09984.1 FAD:protein FMN transferase [Deinococcus metallilatus]RXJ08708.1 FAD:protein FMN transferase [Deinococcus metallilatus]TLK25182.1 FAD:protein FMN transferase [Deinococcus metallilatus]GMA14750.1 FAD:protein FMN transferase [Deinococcus metallilatus]
MSALAEVPDLTLRALGTQVRARGVGAFEALAEVRRLERLLTRFAPSPLTCLNGAGELPDPPPELVEALRHALTVAQETRGWVTPTVLPALEAAGYMRWPGDGPGGAAVRVPDTAGIMVREDVVSLPPGVRLDLGGTAKGWIAWRAARCLRGTGLVDAGGDLQLRLAKPATLGIETPTGTPAYVELPAGVHGVATSSVLRRAWPGGHHLIDPRRGRSARTRFAQVTAVAGDVRIAETLAKLALLDAGEVLEAWLDLHPGALLLAFEGDGTGWEWQPGGWARWAA